jgi:hypothetical protein
MATDDPVMLELQLLQGDLVRFHEEMREQFSDIKQRLGAVERDLGDARRSQTELHRGFLHLAEQMDGLDRRLQRVEKALDEREAGTWRRP